MALRALMLRKKIDQKKKELDALRVKEEEFATREAELTQAIEEAETDEEQAAVDGEIETFNADRSANSSAIDDLNGEISELENELAEEETEKPAEPEERGEKKMTTPEVRGRFGLTAEMMTRDGVAEFISEVRTAMAEKRALTNVGLLVPEVFLGILRENVVNYSKLYKHVNVRRIGGSGRMVVMGAVPEAVWTECCANLNEMDLGFFDVEVDCNKLGAYFAVCNAVLEDSDIDLAAELLDALSQGIGLALDKAILYGTGTKMPLGVVTRLAQTSEPADYPPTARPWVDLHETNILSIPAGATGEDFFKAFIVDAGVIKGAYARGAKVWVMNETTYTQLVSNALAIDAAGAIVSGVNGAMPVIGGVIEVLNFVPDNVIIGGYFELYLLAERRGTQLGQSEHYRFIEDQTVFKGTARYDGLAVIAEAFAAIGINGVTPDATMAFAPDAANSTQENPEG